MPIFTAIYRAIVMVAAGVIVVKGWQLYGPTTEQVKAFGVRAMETAQLTWNNVQPTADQGTHPAADPRLAAPPVAATLPTSTVEPAPLYSAVSGEVDSDVGASPAAEVAGSLAAADSDRLPPLFSRLKELGASDPQLAEWGSSGQMYRFCCRAALVDTPALARHFEAVAAEPVAAVEQVVAKVEAWRANQRDGTTSY